MVLLNTCRSTMQSARTQQVPQSTFDEWVELGYVNEVEYQSGNFYFTLKRILLPLRSIGRSWRAATMGSVFERVLEMADWDWPRKPIPLQSRMRAPLSCGTI